MNSRRISTPVNVAGVIIGGENNPIRIQSMTTTNTLDTEACVKQIIKIVDAGAELVRLTTQSVKHAENLRNIRLGLRHKGYDVPLIADVHFNTAAAYMAAECCEKVRINPGNFACGSNKTEINNIREYSQQLAHVDECLVKLINICKKTNTAIRIGVNHGSLSQRIRWRFGDTIYGIVESCMEMLRICRRENFNNVVLSIKASNTRVMVQSVRSLVRAMDDEDMHYPLHLGVTEAGEGEDGRIKSAVGIGALLTEGIGDTIRVSLSENPENEIPVAKKIISFIQECATRQNNKNIEAGVLKLEFPENENYEDLQLKASMCAGATLIDQKAKDLVIKCGNKEYKELSNAILQAARVKFTKTEFISCPGCGRTLYDLQGTISRIKIALKKAAEIQPKINTLKIGIMGCIVNGPGEMADADFGYVGEGQGKISLYKGNKCIEKGILEQDAVERLLQLIKNNT